MPGSYSKAELVETWTDQICPLQNHPTSLIQPLVLLRGTLSLSLSFSSLVPLLSPLTALRNHTSLSFKCKNLCRLQLVNNSMAHFLAIKLIKIEERGLAHPFSFYARVMGVLAFRVDGCQSWSSPTSKMSQKSLPQGLVHWLWGPRVKILCRDSSRLHRVACLPTAAPPIQKLPWKDGTRFHLLLLMLPLLLAHPSSP